MPTQNMAIRGSKYLGHKWDAFKHLMPAHVVEHINGNAIYNLKPSYALAECCSSVQGIGRYQVELTIVSVLVEEGKKLAGSP